MKRVKEFIEEYWVLVVMCIFASAFIIALAGCSRKTTSVPVVHDTIIKTKTEYINKYLKDSVFVHDSVRVEVKGDTIIIEKNHSEFTGRNRTDTLIVTDTLYRTKDVPYPVEKIKKVFLWWPSILILAIAAGAYIFIRYRKRTS